MANITTGRNTDQYNSHAQPERLSIPVLANGIFYAGTLVGRTAAGYLCNADVADQVLGCLDFNVDATGKANAELEGQVRLGAWKWDNSTGGDLIAFANVGQPAYAVDNHTVALTSNSGARKLVGNIVRVDADGVFVRSNV